MPAAHLQQTKIKGIYLLDDAGFRNAAASTIIKGLPKEEAAEQLYVVESGSIFGGEITGLHQRGRILINGHAIKRAVDNSVRRTTEVAKEMGESLSPIELKKIQKEMFQEAFDRLLLHETAHNFDTPLMGAGFGKGKWRSADPRYLAAKGLGTTSWEELNPQERTKVIEDFVSDYVAYLKIPKYLKKSEPELFKAMKIFFE